MARASSGSLSASHLMARIARPAGLFSTPLIAWAIWRSASAVVIESSHIGSSPHCCGVGSRMTQGVQDQLLLGRPAAVDARLAGAGPRGDRFDGERGVADLGQLGVGRLQDGVLERRTAPAVLDGAVGVADAGPAPGASTRPLRWLSSGCHTPGDDRVLGRSVAINPRKRSVSLSARLRSLSHTV